MMMMMMMRMGGSVPHLDFDFVDGEWTMFQWKVACVRVLQGVSVERNDISKQNNQTLTLLRTLTTKARYLFLNNSLLQLVFQVSTFNSSTVKASISVNSAPLKPLFFFFFFGDFLLKKKNSVLYMIFFIYFKMKILTNAIRNILLREW